MALIEVSGLRKSYGTHEVLHGVDLSVTQGEIVGILGPNGAGKTTTVECIGGLRRPDAGEVRVDGLDPARDPAALRQVLGMQLQQCRLPAKVTARESLDLFGAFYDRPRPTGELLERFGLTGQADQRFEQLSGGQQQRLSVALALIGRPRIAILDELTTGLDPAARRHIWTFLEGLAEEGTTMLLVTHSMEEAQHLCDRVVIISAGSVVATGAPDELATAGGTQRISFVASSPGDVDASSPGDVDASSPVDLAWLRSLPGVHAVTHEAAGPDARIVIDGDADSPQIVLAALSGAGITARELRVTGPSLDDAYLAATRDATTPEEI